MIKFSDRSAAHRLRRESSGTLGSECSRVTPSEGRRRQEEIVQNVAPVKAVKSFLFCKQR
jgi:hypothetical protein